VNFAPFEKLMTEKEAAAILGMSSDTIQRIRKRGEIAFRKIGGRFKYTMSDLAEYLENQRVAPCQRMENSAKLRASGYRNAPARPSGTPLGSTPIPDKHDALRLAQTIFSAPK
jgi:excisionase family DNA binding protein